MITLYLHWIPYSPQNETLALVDTLRHSFPIDLFCSSQYIPSILYAEKVRDLYYADYPKTKPPLYLLPFINDLTRFNKDLSNTNTVLQHIKERKKNHMIKTVDVPLYNYDKHRCDYTMFQEYLYEFFLRHLSKIEDSKSTLEPSYKRSTTFHILIVSHQNYLFTIFRKRLSGNDILSQRLEFVSLLSYYPTTDQFTIDQTSIPSSFLPFLGDSTSSPPEETVYSVPEPVVKPSPFLPFLRS